MPVEIREWAGDLLAALASNHVAQHCSVFVVDEHRGGLVLAAQVWGAGDDTGAVIPGEWLLPLEGSVCGRVCRTGRPELVNDTLLDAEYRGFPGGRSRSEIAVPIRAGEPVIAVLNCESPFVGAFGIEDLDRLTRWATTAGSTFIDRELERHLPEA